MVTEALGKRDYFGNYGAPSQHVYEENVAAQYPLGTLFEDRWGRKFRYAQNGAGALVAGDLVQSAALGGAVTTLQSAALVTVIAALNATRVYLKAITTEQTVDLFNEGWAAIFDVDAVATYTFRIRDHTVIATSGTASYIDLYDELPVALAVNDQVALSTNLYKSVIQMPATTMTGATLGGCMIPVTAAYYFWLQVEGMFGVHIKDGALVAGDPVTTQPTTAGTPITNAETLFQPHIGVATAIWADEGSGLIMLNCDHGGG